MTHSRAVRKLADDLGEILRFARHRPDTAYMAKLLYSLFREGRYGVRARGKDPR